MSLPQIAIVGRPNVGKSSLFNRLVGRRVSIVDPTPGTTRDRVSQLVEILPPTDLPYDRSRDAAPKLAELVDTGGYGVYMAEGGRFDDAGEDLTRLTPEIEAQIKAGIERATLILFVVDAQTGVTGLDERIARLVRETGRADRVLLVANKVDDDSWIAAAQDASRLGFGEPAMTSASSAFGKRAFLEEIWNRLPEWVEPVASPEMKIAIVGRRNAGKSTLINALAGEPRVIVSEIAGTTRDSIDVRFEMDGHAFVAIDTAGVRKRKSWVDDIEYYSHQRAKAAIERADVCVLLLDAREPVTQVEKRLALELVNQHKPTVIAVNKWDLVESKLKTSDYIDYLTQELFALEFAPLVFLSAAKGEGIGPLVKVCRNLFGQAHHRETTGRLNAVIKSILADRGPSSKLGTKAKIYYVSQIATNPPTIAIVVNKPELFEGAYERYLMNQLHEQLPFSEVPIKLVFSARKRLTPAELAARKRAGSETGDGEGLDGDAYGD
ncbi:MAG: GTPase Der [Planctomycetota bacterium]|jgi:GTP-binding protein